MHYFDRFLHHDVRTSYFAKWPDPTLEFKHKVALDVTPAYIFYYSVPTYMKVVAPEYLPSCFFYVREPFTFCANPLAVLFFSTLLICFGFCFVDGLLRFL